MNKFLYYINFGLLFILYSCRVDTPIVPALPADDLKEIIPQGWPTPKYRFENNPIKKEVFVLGRELFYDPILSRDNSVSCGSCHQQFVAFANADHDLSHGVDNRLGTRNSPALFNLNWHEGFMHDGGVNNIEVQPINPVENPVEMDLPFPEAMNRLRSSSKYIRLFQEAYGDNTISDARMLKAMGQFMALMYSYNSRFDQYKRGENGVSLNEQELRGYNLFKQKCDACHKEPLFSDFSYRNNGLKPSPTIQDSGRYRITQDIHDVYKFKVPSLRNIAITGPYMHDGRYQTLEQCLDHYTDKIENFSNLDPLLVSGISLTAQEKKDIIAFLRTLTDYQFINDPRFSEPKK